MDNQFPLYPKLDDIAQDQAEELTKRFLETFKKRTQDIMEDLTNEFVYAIVDHIEGDAWQNFRTEILNGLCNYDNRKIQSRYDFDKIRESIYRKYRNEIIADLNQDLVKENEELKKKVDNLQEYTRQILERNRY